MLWFIMYTESFKKTLQLGTLRITKMAESSNSAGSTNFLYNVFNETRIKQKTAEITPGMVYPCCFPRRFNIWHFFASGKFYHHAAVTIYV